MSHLLRLLLPPVFVFVVASACFASASPLLTDMKVKKEGEEVVPTIATNNGSHHSTSSQKKLKQKFLAFKHRFNKEYNSRQEEQHRFDIFAKNMALVEEEFGSVRRGANSSSSGAIFGITKFSDQSLEERRHARSRCARWQREHRHHQQSKSKNGRRGEQSPLPSTAARLLESRRRRHRIESDKQKSSIHAIPSKWKPDSVDWSKHGVVSPVRDQGSCGSCWAFASAGNIEGVRAVKYNEKVIPASVQELVACDSLDYGCDGSNAYQDTLEWIKKDRNGTLATWASYPYASSSGTSPRCKKGGDLKIAVRGVKHGFVVDSDEDKMAEIVATLGPMQISIESRVLDHYVSGVITHGDIKCHPEQIDHEVLITGFDSSATTPYWIVKNSWGKDWGESGYFRVEMGWNAMCVADYPWMFEVEE